MAAPPIPPKGGSDAWLRGNVVTDPHSWRADSQNLFTGGSQPKTCFNDNFSPVFSSSTKQSAKYLGIFQIMLHLYHHVHLQKLFKKVTKPSFDELNRVPPPPGSGQLYKNPSPDYDILHLDLLPVLSVLLLIVWEKRHCFKVMYLVILAQQNLEITWLMYSIAALLYHKLLNPLHLLIAYTKVNMGKKFSFLQDLKCSIANLHLIFQLHSA
ncbi:phosphatidylinositol-4-phosphate 3-kinase [Caerostris extrusa]|uniref:Phosphatidylinositol-4-phosphate 3-kinase n=1 Tax=Caerostris extrusa TaxID=172846 RepID=A0AAV4N9B4_CAEEX|nr:phosphatidylinositol-4-phosphate 3-kinase [Caerostris extrusa]